MGRNVNPGISFYRVDAGHILNTKVRLLYNEFDSDGYYIWSCLLDRAYGKWGYYFDTNNPDELELFASEFCKKKVTLVREVINGCLRRGLFDQSVYETFKVLTCDMMQDTFIHATGDRRAKGSVFEMRQDWLLIDLSKDVPPNILIVPGKKAKLPGKNPENPLNNPQIREEDIKAEEEKKRKEGFAPATPPRPKKGVVKKSGEETEPYWQVLVKVWFDFGIEKFKVKPSFARDDPKIFLRIIDRLKKRAADASKAWDEKSAPQRLRYFLDSAFSDEWLSKHFLLKNLEGQFDVIIQKQAAVAKKSRSTTNYDLQYLYERFLEGGLDMQFITDAHFDELAGKNLVNPDYSCMIPLRVKSLVGSNVASELRLLDAYQQGRATSETESDAAVLRRMAVITFFRLQKSKNYSDVFQA